MPSSLNLQNPFKLAVEAPIHNPLSVMQPGEEIICEIKRHPIGIIAIYIAAGFLLLLLAVLTFGVMPSIASEDNKPATLSVGIVVILVVSILVSVFLYISHKVYWGNSWILTSDSLIQVIQTSLFDKKTSQLSLYHLEDVGAVQDGLLTHLFNYGTITAESAGATDTFTFLYCPNPNYYAHQIVAAREGLEQRQREEPLTQPQYPPQTPLA